MNQSIVNTLSKDADKSVQIIQSKLTELKNVQRLSSNAVNLLNDMEIKGAYSGPMAEVLGWLTRIKDDIANQITTLESTLVTTLPKQEVNQAGIVQEAEIVK